MRLYVVKDETSAEDLRQHLLRARASRARVAAFDESLRAANPHADLDDLRPGTVLVVPDHPDLRAGADLVGAGLAVGMDALVGALPAVEEAARTGLDTTGRQAEALRAALAVPEVRKITEADPVLRPEAQRLTEAVVEPRRRAEAWAGAVRAQVERWTADLDGLRELD
jgi:hypothetical protein